MSLSTADKIFLVVGLADFAGIFVWMGVCLHMASTRMDLMLGHLKNSPVLNSLIPLRPGSLWGKVVFVGGISGVVTFPRFYLKRGVVSAEDLRGFPEPLKRKLVAMQWIGIALLFVMVCLGAVAKLDLV